VGSGERRGRRDNGLTASEYVAAGDVDPRVGEHLLDVLGLAGIAAYLRPSSDLNPVTRSNVLPARPTDRLYVDRSHLGTAREYLAKLKAESEPSAAADVPSGGDTGTEPRPSREDGGVQPGVDGTGPTGPVRPDPTAPPGSDLGNPTRGEPDLDEAWAQIVAGFNADAGGTSWPASEDVTSTEQPGRPDGRDLGWGDTRADRGRIWRREASISPAPDEPSLLDGLDTFGADLPDAEEPDFTPPPAPPMPRPSAVTVLAVLGVVGGIALFLRPSLLPTSVEFAMLFGVAALLAGFATLVWRLRPGDDDDSDPDDGARV